MSIFTRTDWTLLVEDHGYCTVRQYRTKTELKGEDEYHRGTEQVGYTRFHVADLGKYVMERGIKEFCTEEDMHLSMSMPHDPS